VTPCFSRPTRPAARAPSAYLDHDKRQTYISENDLDAIPEFMDFYERRKYMLRTGSQGAQSPRRRCGRTAATGVTPGGPQRRRSTPRAWFFACHDKMAALM